MGLLYWSPLRRMYIGKYFMGYLEYNLLPDFKSEVNYFRYVDDCFIITKSEKLYLTFK